MRSEHCTRSIYHCIGTGQACLIAYIREVIWEGVFYEDKMHFRAAMNDTDGNGKGMHLLLGLIDCIITSQLQFILLLLGFLR